MAAGQSPGRGRDDPSALTARLREAADQHGVAVSDNQADLLVRYLQELARWNRVHNLTAVRRPIDMVERHILDSLSVAHLLRGSSIADAGSGAGLPGIPLAIMEPERRFVLIERSPKKAGFLTHAVYALGLANASVQCGSLQDYRPAVGFDTVVARALAELKDLVYLVRHLLAPGGVLLAMKGPRLEEELRGLPPGFAIAASERLPAGERDRRAVLIREASR